MVNDFLSRVLTTGCGVPSRWAATYEEPMKIRLDVHEIVELHLDEAQLLRSTRPGRGGLRVDMSTSDERPAVFELQPDRAPSAKPTEEGDVKPSEPTEPDDVAAASPDTTADAPPDAEVPGPDEDPEPSGLQSPVEYLVELCGLHQIVLVGDLVGVAQHVETLVEVVPALHEAGVDLAWEFTNSRAQDRLDALVGAAVWDPRGCADLFVDLLGVGFAYQEYADVLHAAWQTNQDSPHLPPFRIVALGVPSYVEDPELLEGRSAGELELRNWWMGGHYRDLTAFHMANVVTAEVIRHGRRALVYCAADRTTTRLVEWHDGLAPATVGNLLHRWMGEGVQRVLFHGAVDDIEAIQRVEALIEAAPEDVDELGIDLELSTLGNVGITGVIGTIGGEQSTFRLRDLADGYLFVAPLEEWRPCELLDDLIAPANFVDIEARYRALDPRDERYTQDELEEVRREGQATLSVAWPQLPEPEEPEAKRGLFRRRSNN